MLHESLSLFYRLNFQLMQHHKYTLNDLENMLPWEREIYISLLKNYLEEERIRRDSKGS